MKRIKITFCRASGKLFGNLTAGSDHTQIECPENKKDLFGDDVWVMGTTEPVRLMKDEYEILSHNSTLIS